jgi:hypothetical protein
MHVRQQIREAIGTVLMGLPSTAGRVYQSRVYPVEDADLPALLVYAEGESSVPSTVHSPRVLERNLRLRVTAIAKSNADVDDTLDTICLEVETALANPVAALDPLARNITLTDTAIDLSGDTERPVGMATLSFEVGYFTAENAPDVAL